MAEAERRPLSEAELTACINALRKSPCWSQPLILIVANRALESLDPFRTQYVNDQLCLEFRNCTLPPDPSPLKAAVPYLTDLACYNGTTVSWASLDFLNTVNHLNILVLTFDGSTAVDLSALDGLESPTRLYLANASINQGTLSVIGGIERLETLGLPNGGITDITPLARRGSLTELNLSQNLISDFSPLEQLPRLRRLDSSKNHT